MAAKTVTIDTNEWKYIDSVGLPHIVTNGQTFTFELTDGGAAAVTYNVIPATITTTDGHRLVIDTIGKRSTIDIGTLADAGDATNYHNRRGHFRITCTSTGVPQEWRIAQITVDNADAPTAITKLILEDQLGHIMVLPSDGAGWTVA